MNKDLPVAVKVYVGVVLALLLGLIIGLYVVVKLWEVLKWLYNVRFARRLRARVRQWKSPRRFPKFVMNATTTK